MFCKRMAALHKKGRERLEELREQYRGETERLIGVLGEVLAGAREATTLVTADPGPEITAEPAEESDEPAADAASAQAPVAVVPEEEIAQRAGRLLLKTLESAGGLDA